MKTIQILCLSALLSFAIGCKKDAPAEPTVEQQEQGTLPDATATDTVSPAATDTVAVDSMTTPKWLGNYSGVLPCGGDCKGIKTEITLKAANAYTLSSQAIGRDAKPALYKGTFYLDKATNIVTLDAEGDHLKFKIIDDGADGMLQKLDKFGADEQGGPAARYFLHKVQ